MYILAAGILVPFSSWRDVMMMLAVVDNMNDRLVSASYISMAVTVSADVVPYAIVMWASPALNAFIGYTPLPMLYV